MIELLHTWNWNPYLWTEMSGALGGVWMAIAWPYFRHNVWYEKLLIMLIVYLGAPMLTVFALIFFVYKYLSKERA